MEEKIYHLQYIAEDKFWWFLVRNRIVYELINNYCKIPENSTVLDIGCGTGGFTRFLNIQYNVIGIDSSQIALDYCRKRGLSNLYCGILDDFNFKNENIQIITLLDVIEHIENDVDILQKSYDLLDNNGYIVITVPAYQWLWSNHDVLHRHYRRYTKKRLVELMQGSGFKVLYTSYFNTLLFLPAVFLRFIEKITGKTSNSELENPEPALNGIFKIIFGFEQHLLKKIIFPFGLSIIIIAKKE